MILQRPKVIKYLTFGRCRVAGCRSGALCHNYLHTTWNNVVIHCHFHEQENGDMQFYQKASMHHCSTLITGNVLRDANPNSMTCFLLLLSSGADKGNWCMIVLQIEDTKISGARYVYNLLTMTYKFPDTVVKDSLSNIHIYVYSGVFVIYCVSTYLKSLKQGGSASC